MCTAYEPVRCLYTWRSSKQLLMLGARTSAERVCWRRSQEASAKGSNPRRPFATRSALRLTPLSGVQLVAASGTRVDSGDFAKNPNDFVAKAKAFVEAQGKAPLK
jgi:hypothetical protein